MLVAFLISAISIGIGEFRVTGLFNVSIVTNGEIGSRSKSWSKVDRIENSTFFINKGHFLFERK